MEEKSGNMIKLTAFNYAIWKPKMEDLLYIKDLWRPIVIPMEEPTPTSKEVDPVTKDKSASSSGGKPTIMSESEWMVLNRKCAAQIRQWIDKSIFQNFANEHDAGVLWQKLEKMYARTTAQNKANHMRRLVNLKYEDGSSVSEHMSEFQGIVDQLNSMKMTLDDELQALLLLSSLPKSWDTLVVSVSNSAPDDEIIIIQSDDSINHASQDSTWVVDSGASYHVTACQDLFTSYSTGNFGFVKMGNDGTSKITGMGNIYLETNVGCTLLLKDVRHVPDMRLNLISTSKLDDEGYSNFFSNGKWKLTKGNLVVAKGEKTCSLYITQSKLCRGEVNVTGKGVTTELWHKRLGHMSKKGSRFSLESNSYWE
ncbi:uncharacterized protein LOC130137702 [Syzygium oleosum]|uniref:uncharacterized protein LOC130137702 n=1 Tax=Syzygium oleosum TaxID=219896 RepID=UPI0024B91E63|nr:uncharacterized protein LOC130137702 [Syzygium oleosum]